MMLRSRSCFRCLCRMRALINHVTVLTMDKSFCVHENGFVLIENGRVAACGDGDGLQAAEELRKMAGNLEGTESCGPCPADGLEIVDGHGGILMPGLINTHSHLSMIPFRSMGDDCPDRLRKFLFPLELEAMTPELIYRAARYAVCEMLLSGVTAAADMYYFEDQVAKACEELGIYAWVGETIIDMETCDSKNTAESLESCEKLLKKWSGHDRIHPMAAPHATNTNSPEDLKAAWELAETYEARYMLHVSEMDYEMSFFRDTYGKTPVEFLYDLGVMGPRTVAAHGIHLTEHDIRLFAETGTKLAHCAGANTKAGKGICPVYEAQKAGVTVGIGTDGPSSGNTLDLFTQLRMIPSFQKTKYHDRSIMTAKEVLAMGTVEGAKVLGAEAEMGSIEAGKRANLVLVETDSANMFPVYNPHSAIVYSANASNVDSVWIDGKRLVKGHRLLGTDLRGERELLEREMTVFRRQAQKYADII